MSVAPKISVGSGGTLVPINVLAAIGVQAGDEVSVTVRDRQLILSPAIDADRQRTMEQITREILENRKDAYQRLA